MTRQKNRSNEQQSRASIQAAEAVALGTMAGGLALGAVQAREAQPLPEDDARLVPVAQAGQAVDGQMPAQPATNSEAPAAQSAPTAEALVAATGSQENPEVTSSEESELAALETPVAATSAPELQAVAADSPATEQVSAAIERLVTEVTNDTAIEGSALPLAGQILDSVADIVSALKPGLDVSALSSLGSTLKAQVETILEPTESLLGDLPDTIGSTVSTALGGTLSSSLTDTIALGGLPSSLLGNDGPISDQGLLSNLFYSDGESDIATPSLIGQSVDSLEIPELAATASSLVTDVADAGVGLLGLNYTDLSPDGFSLPSGGVGGLGLL